MLVNLFLFFVYLKLAIVIKHARFSRVLHIVLSAGMHNTFAYFLYRFVVFNVTKIISNSHL